MFKNLASAEVYGTRKDGFQLSSSPIRRVLALEMPFCASLTLYRKSALERVQEARFVHLNFSAALDRDNHQGILFKVRSVGIGGSVLPVLTVSL